jgi:hypothetical protein
MSGEPGNGYEGGIRAMAASVEPHREQTGPAGGANIPDDDGNDPAKALVMSCLGELVNRGCAELSPRADGDIELRLLGGGVFVLGSQTVTRVA